MKKKWLWAISIFLLIAGIWIFIIPSYEEHLFSKAGMDRHQDYQVLWTEQTVTGFDHSTFVCFAISDVESNRLWVGLENLNSDEATIFDFGMSFPPTDDCVGPPLKMLVLNARWVDGFLQTWSFFLLDDIGQRLMYVSGKI